MEEKLKQAQKTFEIEEYKKKALPEVLEYLKEAKKKKDGKTVYNAELTAEIMRAENLPEEWEKYLNTEVYLAQQDLRAEEEEAHKQKMEADGWLPLTHTTEYRGKIELVANKDVDWMSAKIATEAKLVEAHDGGLFAIPKGKRTRGYAVAGLKNAFYKPFNQ